MQVFSSHSQLIKLIPVSFKLNKKISLFHSVKKKENIYANSFERNFTKTPILFKKKKAEGEALSFVDYCNVTCVSGAGGNGLISFLREHKVEFGGPDGGNGGNGGHVIFKADPMVTDLSKVKKIIKASNGKRGNGRCCHGKDAEHVVVSVPLNTLIKKPSSNHRNLNEGIIHELTLPDEIFIAARGGAGGHGNNFYLSNLNRKPITAELGGKGEIQKYELEMRIMATAGLVGFPNAGKSSFLRAISRAKPKVASYPFTTVKAHVGMVMYDDFIQIAVADIPGIIEDAHKNVGLGFSFLRHICRCESIFYVLDYTLGDWQEQFEALKRELLLYNKNLLSDKLAAILINKCDLIKNEADISFIKNVFSNEKLFFVSAREKIGLEPVLTLLRENYDLRNKNKKLFENKD